MRDLVQIKQEVNEQLASPEILQDLVNTTFKGLQPQTVKRAILEGVMRGFEFKDFLEKNIYAVPFGGEYSLVTSIDHARKIGMRSGIVGKSAPVFEEKDGQIISCTVTVKRKVGDYIGDYTDTVYFNEYTTNRNLWKTKPHTMISKVAEMHALRMACPEEMAQMYVEEEYAKGDVIETIDQNWREEIAAIDNLEDLKAYYLKNKGKGAEFDKLVTTRKAQLMTPPPGTEVELTPEEIAEIESEEKV